MKGHGDGGSHGSRPPLFTAAPALHLGNYQYCCYSAITNATTLGFIYQFLHPLQLVTSQDPETSQRVRASVQNQQPDFYQHLKDVLTTEIQTRFTICAQGSPFFFLALQVPMSRASPMRRIFWGWSTDKHT